MLASFNQLGYSVEWRVINAAEYGRAQRRRRVYFFVYRNDLPYAQKLDKIYENTLRDVIGNKVVVTKNKITIPFDSESDLDRIMEILKVEIGE